MPYYYRIGLLWILLLASSLSSTGQPALDPSLRRLLRSNELPDAERIAEIPRLRAWLRAHPTDKLGRFLAYKRLTADFEIMVKPDSTYEPLVAAARLGQQLAPAYPLERAVVLRQLGAYYLGAGVLDSSLRHLAQAARLYKADPRQGRMDTITLVDGQPLLILAEMAELTRFQAMVFERKGDVRRAAPYYEQALHYQKARGDEVEAASVLRRLGLLHIHLNQPNEARRYLAEVLRIARQQASVPTAAMMTSSTIDTYMRLQLTPADKAALLAATVAMQQRLQPALRAHPNEVPLLFQAAWLAQSEAQLRPGPRGRILQRADSLFTRMRRLSQASTLEEWDYYLRRTDNYILWLKERPDAVRLARTYLDSIALPISRVGTSIGLARALNQAGQPKVALEVLEPVLAGPLRQGVTVLRQTALGQLSTAYGLLKDYPRAYAARLEFDRLQDSIRTREQFLAVNDLEVRYRTEQKEQRIMQLTQQRRIAQLNDERQKARVRLLGVAVGGLLLALLVFGLLYRRLRRAQAQLQAATRTKDRLYSIIGHDLRSPLTAFAGLADMISFYRQRGELDALDELTQEVRQTTGRLTGLLDNLLLWAATQSGELAYVPEPLAVTELLTEVVALYEPAARARLITLAVAAPAGLALRADRNMTLTMLRNLVSNALKVSPAGSTITLRAEAVGPEVVLTVQDQGPGLTAAQVQTLQSATVGVAAALPGRRGTGLGLPLVRQLAQRQQGAFELASAPGQGTTARIRLPRTEAVPTPAAVPVALNNHVST
jgi:signal transduction histidine kinase/tetratricopeptide (TPR) repeat protein